MRYKLFRGSIHINTVEADEAFIKRYCDKYSYTYEAEELPAPKPEPTTEERVAALEEQLLLTDETAIELYEMQMAQEEINAAQDDALIEIYEMIGG